MSETLLLADDNELRRRTRVEWLREAEFRVIEAGSVSAVMDCTAQYRPAAVVLSGMASDPGSPELSRQLRLLVPAPLLLSLASAESPAWEEADIYLREPLSPRELIATVKTCIRFQQRGAESCDSPAIEEGRHESGQRLRAAVDAAAVGTWWVDLETGRDTRDGSLNRLLGLPAESLTASVEDFFSYVHSEDLPGVRRAYEEALAGDGFYRAEFRVVRTDGEVRWMRARGRREGNSEGKPGYVCGAVVDITGQKCREEIIRRLNVELRRKVEDFEALFAAAPVGIAVAEDPEARSLRLNPAFERLLGFRSGPNPFLGNSSRPPQRLMSGGKELREEDLPLVKAVRTGKAVHTPVDVVWPDGRISHLNGNAMPLFDEQGKVRGAISVALDITPYRKIVAEMGRREADLREAQRLAGVGGWEWDLSTDVIAWSDEMFRIYGRDPATGNHSYAEHLTFYAPDSAGQLAEAVERALRLGEPYELDLEVKRPDGRLRWIVGRGEARRDARGRIVGLRGTVQDVTERKIAADELDRRLAEIEAIYDTAPVGLCVLDADGRYLRINRRLAEIKGIPADVQLGKSSSELLPQIPEVVKTTAAVLRKVIATGDPVLGLEVSGEASDEPGNPRHFVTHGYPLIQDGVTYAVNIVVEEITDRKRTEEALRKSEERLQFTLSCAEAGYWDANLVTGETIWSDKLYDMYGFDPRQGSPSYAEWLSRLHPDDRGDVDASFRKQMLADPRAEVNLEFRILHPERGERWISDICRLSCGPDGTPVRMGGLNFDITDRKREEKRIRFLARLLDAVDQAIIVNDLDWKIIYWNRFAEHLYGWLVEEAMGQDVLKLIAPEFTDMQRAQLMTLLLAGAPVSGEFTVRHRDGYTFPVLATDSPVYDEEGRLAYVICTSVDISERKKAENDLRALNESLAVADRRKNEFLAMLAHELRNPLAPIRNAVQVMRSLDHGDAPNLAWARDVIDRQVSHLARLVDDLLDVSRLVRGRIELRREAVDLADVVERALEVARPIIQSHRHELIVELPGEALWVDADPMRMIQVLENLLTNAAKYTPEGGCIRLEAAIGAGEAVIRVADNGMGIPEDLLPHVFDLFTQNERSLDRSQGGLGIGLTIVKKLVEMHGGTIAVRSGREGSEFTVALPLSQARPEPVQPEPSKENSGEAGAARRILVEDDNEDARESLALLLEFDGHDVLKASDGPAALIAAREFRPEAILLDIGLPGMDGYEVARRLRVQPETAGILLLAVTGYGQQEDRQRAEAAGFDHHLVKPIDPEALARLLAGDRA